MTDPAPTAAAPPQTPPAAAEAATTAAAKTLNALLHMPAQMELSQIELIYRAEGNANLVLALPQFKKVLRLPKMISSRQTQRQFQAQAQAQDICQPSDIPRPEGQPNVSDPTKASSPKAGDLTMPDFMAYIEIMRRLLGNEFVCEADIVAIPKEGDRFWINEHIRAHRPVARLDKEFVGPFGLLMPDVTQLPATFDVLLANLQAKDMNTDMNADICSDSNNDSDNDSSTCDTGTETGTECGVTRLGDTYAIEIKPKQGWLQLASDVSNLFDLMPAGAETMDSTYEPKQLLLLPSAENKCRCRYCSMQQLKLHTGKIKRLGDYCPLELFSGAPRRMLDALNALFACPQNNLRVFQSGNLIYGDHANSISCEELHARVFPNEIMALIKHLLVACLLREYNNGLEKGAEQGRSSYQTQSQIQSQSQSQIQSHSHVAGVAIGESASKRCGMETKATKTTEIGAANVDAAAAVAAAAWQVGQKQVEQAPREQKSAGIVEFVKAVAGQPQRCSTRAAVEKATQRYTKRSRITTTTSEATTATTATTCKANTTIASTWLSANVARTATRMETETKTKTLPTAIPTTTEATTSTSSLNPDETQAQINDAEIFHLPKNCVLQKILHLQLSVKQHFAYMWQTGHAKHATPSYQTLQALLSCGHKLDELPPEQAYMLGATALDCSIMLTFQEIRCQAKHNSSLEPWLVSLQGRQFLTKVSVLDLDPKPDSHFHKFIKHTCEIEKCCRALN